MASVRQKPNVISRLALLVVLAFDFAVYGGRPVKEVWGDPQIAMYIPRLAAIAAAVPAGERSLTALSKELAMP